MDEIDEAVKILRYARDQGQVIYVRACIKYIKTMNPCEEPKDA